MRYPRTEWEIPGPLRDPLTKNRPVSQKCHALSPRNDSTTCRAPGQSLDPVPGAPRPDPRKPEI